MQSSYDVVVLGGGPAGSSVATVVAAAGHSTLLVEREKMPRFHVGESLMPETFWPLQRLGLIDKMKQSDFVEKHSVAFVSHSGKESNPFFFREHDPRESSSTWQVERADFDKMLFDNAREHGADAIDDTRARDVIFAGDRATGVVLRDAAGNEQTIEAQVVVDATGQQALLANKLGIREVNPNLKKVAIWTYYRNAYREPGEHGGATIILHTRDKESWFWWIPLKNGITSVGCVGDRDYLLDGRGKPEEIYQEELDKCPKLQEWLADAQRSDEYRVAKEFSYSTKQHAGPSWVLIGDAWGFIDPIYSSGVYFALHSGVLAGDAIVEGLANSDLSGEQLGKWTAEFGEGTQWIRKLVHAYYSNEFSFGHFMKEHPEHRGNLTDLLIGRIFYDGAGRIFDDMDPAIEQSLERARDNASAMQSADASETQ